jgi:hypothetical protein
MYFLALILAALTGLLPILGQKIRIPSDLSREAVATYSRLSRALRCTVKGSDDINANRFRLVSESVPVVEGSPKSHRLWKFVIPLKVIPANLLQISAFLNRTILRCCHLGRIERPRWESFSNLHPAIAIRSFESRH